MSDPAHPVIDELLAALSPSGGIHPGLARHVGQQLRGLRPPTVDAAALCEPYLRIASVSDASVGGASVSGASVSRAAINRVAIDGVAISTLGSAFGAETVAASDPTAARLDEIQLQLRQGPCWDAIAAAAPVAMPDAGAEDRWPAFSESVGALGVRAVFAFPLVVAGLLVGAVDLYSRTAGPLGAGLVEELAATTARTSLRVLSIVLPEPRYEGSGRPATPRAVHHATGIVAARYRTSPADALLLLRAHAVAGDRRVLDVAEDVVAGADAFADAPLPVRGRER